MAKSFLGKGLHFPLRVNAVGGMAMSEGELNIEQSIASILGTAVGERVMRPTFGCRIHDFVFHPNSASTAGMVAFYVREALHKWEPRITDLKVTAHEDPRSQNVLVVEVAYKVRSTNVDRNYVYPFYLRREQDL